MAHLVENMFSVKQVPWHGLGTVLDNPPTAENLASTAFRILDSAYQDTYGNHLRLEQVRLFETPNCWADAVREQVSEISSA